MRRLAVGLGALALHLLSTPTSAQVVRPSDEPLIVPEPSAPPAEEPLDLPPLPAVPPATALSAGLRVYVRAFEIRGSTVFSAEALASAVARYTGREITSEELLAARDAVTLLYVNAGYLTSGATVPDQDVADGVVRLDVVEGRLASVRVEGNHGFRDGYFRRRLLAAGRAPLDVATLEERLRLFQLDPLIARVHARLEPGEARGESVLVVRVDEARGQHLAVGTANDRPPSVGSTGGIVWGEWANLIGVRDLLSVRGEVTSGLWEIDLRYEVPITRLDTRLGLRFLETQSEVVEPPFDTLDIDASSRNFGVSVMHPFHRSDRSELWLGLLFEYRSTEATLLDLPFCFQPETFDCAPTVTVLRAVGEYTRRSARNVLAARMTLSWGIDALGATVAPAGAPDGLFVSWLAQAQWVHVLPESARGTQLVVRSSAQLASQPLLSIERYALGGHATVRGYRENQLVRDNGVSGSVEIQIPLWRDALRRPIVQLVPFVDAGHAWNDAIDLPIETLASAGVGVRVIPQRRVRAELFWGQRLVDVPNPRESAQDYGLYFELSIDVF